VILAAVPAAASAVWGPWPLTLGLSVLVLGMAAFFRDPERASPTTPGLVLAPADGTVQYAGPAAPGDGPPGEWRQVSIFLALTDVHVNRTPVPGRVLKVEYVPGTFRPAYRHDASRNEHSEIWIDTGGAVVVTRQVVGVLARRVVCRVRPGETLAPGARIGLMKFGSRMDVFVPATATLTVTRGDRVRAGVTVVARLAGPNA
jgi:phosphatidylserine decarboxylase